MSEAFARPAIEVADLKVAASPTAGRGLALDETGKIPGGAFPDYHAYTPVWTSSGTQPALVDGSAAGRWVQIGKHVHYWGGIIFGASSTFGTGSYAFSLPLPAFATISSHPIGQMNARDTSGAVELIGEARLFTATTLQGLYVAAYPTGAITAIAVTAPWTWAVGDSINWSVIYEAA